MDMSKDSAPYFPKEPEGFDFSTKEERDEFQQVSDERFKELCQMEEPLQKLLRPEVKERETVSIVHSELKRGTLAWQAKIQEVHANRQYRQLKTNLGLPVSSNEEDDEEPKGKKVLAALEVPTCPVLEKPV